MSFSMSTRLNKGRPDSANTEQEERNYQQQKKLMEEILANPTTKPYLPKKKLRQAKLQQSFSRKNFQKYPIDKCVYDPLLKQWYYEPPKWKKEFEPLELAHAKRCPHCGLKPCLVEGKELSFKEALKNDHEDREFAMQNEKIHANNLLMKYCGKLYMKRMKLVSPGGTFDCACVNEALPRLFEQVIAELHDKLLVDHEEIEIETEWLVEEWEDSL